MQTTKAILCGGIMSLLGSVVFADADYVPFGNPFVECERVLNGYVPCRERTEFKSGTDTYNFPHKDWSWKCSALNNLEVSFFNSSPRTVHTVIIEGINTGRRISEDVYVLAGKSGYVYSRAGSIFCDKKEGGKLYSQYTYKSGGGCLKRYSDAEVQDAIAQCREKVAVQKERSTIYNNCVIAKSKDIDKRALINVRSVCREISENPSTLQRWRWGD